MSALTREFLEKIDIKLDDQTYDAFVDHFDTTLHERVIDSTIDSLSDDQIAQLAKLRGSSNQERLWQWLASNTPEFNDIIRAEIDILLGELAENSEHI